MSFKRILILYHFQGPFQILLRLTF
uniref:Uncharacterized protein n=1 Tax=Arundo donax TaxID=35708 RepID=A0A0A9BKD9_ARUDO